jgi:hypothetical protein
MAGVKEDSENIGDKISVSDIGILKLIGMWFLKGLYQTDANNNFYLDADSGFDLFVDNNVILDNKIPFNYNTGLVYTYTNDRQILSDHMIREMFQKAAHKIRNDWEQYNIHNLYGILLSINQEDNDSPIVFEYCTANNRMKSKHTLKNKEKIGLVSKLRDGHNR